MQRQRWTGITPSSSMPLPEIYPPERLSPDHLQGLLRQIKDYQSTHGSLLKVLDHQPAELDSSTTTTTPAPAPAPLPVPVHIDRLQPVGVSVFPTIFPRRLFREAIDELQTLYNELYCKVAADACWLYAVTGSLRRVDPLVDALWSVYEEVRRQQHQQQQQLQRSEQAQSQYVEQCVHAAVVRSDYMLHVQDDDDDDDDDDDEEEEEEDLASRNLCLKQVEFNSYSCAGGIHADKVAKMHRYLVRRGVYRWPVSDYSYNCNHSDQDVDNNHVHDEADQRRQRIEQLNYRSLPANETTKGIASLLASAHRLYGSKPYCSTASHTAVLMVVQPNNYNIADERPIEYALWNWTEKPSKGAVGRQQLQEDEEEEEAPIPTYRIEWQAILRYTRLTPTGELLFFPPENGGHSTDYQKQPVEISVVYHRAGYDLHEYSDNLDGGVSGKDIRIRLELSRAIKCPSILGHIATFKKVQQALTLPGNLERWLSPDKAARLRRTFVKIHSCEQILSSSSSSSSSSSDDPDKIAVDDEEAMKNYILKPASREGGGHNIYNSSEICETLKNLDPAQRSAYILMERILSPQDVYGMLVSPSRGIVTDEVVSELGIFGGCLVQTATAPTASINVSSSGYTEPLPQCRLIMNKVIGWSFKTKEAVVDEMSVVKGYGCFDTPVLI